MRRLRHSINVTLDGCCHHQQVSAHSQWGKQMAPECFEQQPATLWKTLQHPTALQPSRIKS